MPGDDGGRTGTRRRTRGALVEEGCVDQVTLQIAGITIALEAEGETLRPPREPAYAEFLVRSPVDAPSIRIKRTDEWFGAPSEYALVFDTEGAWRLYRSGDGFLITAQSGGDDALPFWALRMDSEFSRGELWVNAGSDRQKERSEGLAFPLVYPLDQILLVNHLASRGGVLLHACGAQIGREVIVCAGPCGAGKSTLARILRDGSRHPLLSDDRVVVRDVDGELLAFGTPWAGDGGVASSRCGPLRSLCFLHHGSANTLRPLPGDEAASRLCSVASIPWYDRQFAEKVLGFLDRLFGRVPTYDLPFAPDSRVISTLEGLT